MIKNIGITNLFRMPGGEQHINTEGNRPLTGNQILYVQFGGSDDILKICLWADAVHRDGGNPHLLLPYLPGARQDRRQPGEALSCKVYADIINGCNFTNVVCADPHSDVMPALINNLTIVSPEEILKYYLLPVYTLYEGIIIPDAGATKRCQRVAAAFNLPTYQAYKHRDMSTGKLSGFSCEELPPHGTFLVVDDICDGGGTFMGLAAAIGPEVKLDLFVTHGIFSGDNAENLYKYFGRIITTDSHQGGITAEYNQKFKDILTRYPLQTILRNKI